MDDRLQELGNVLADPTRVQTLRFVLSSRTPVSVATVASQFGLHPNAARHHLSKLEAAGLVGSLMERNPRGGRPAKLYGAGKERVEIQFPGRQYSLLSKLLLDALERTADRLCTMGESIDEVGFAYGKDFAAKNADLRVAGERSAQDLIRECLAQTERLGCRLELVEMEDDRIVLEERNCVFEDAANHSPQVICRMHWAILKGMLSWYCSDISFDSIKNMVQGDDVCRCVVRMKVATREGQAS